MILTNWADGSVRPNDWLLSRFLHLGQDATRGEHARYHFWVWKRKSQLLDIVADFFQTIKLDRHPTLVSAGEEWRHALGTCPRAM